MTFFRCSTYSFSAIGAGGGRCLASPTTSRRPSQRPTKPPATNDAAISTRVTVPTIATSSSRILIENLVNVARKVLRTARHVLVTHFDVRVDLSVVNCHNGRFKR